MDGMSVKSFCCSVLFIFAACVSAKELPESFAIGPAPAWVKLQEISDEGHADNAQTRGGVSYLLVDEQKNVAANYASYRHFVTRILNAKGVESESTIDLDYNPAYQTLVFHGISVIRQGQTINKLNEDRVEIFRREKDMDIQLYDGRLTVNIILEDIREGDVLAYSYTLSGRNPARVAMGTSTDYFNTQWSVPVAKQYRRLLWPADKPVYFRYFARELKPEVSTYQGLDEYIWEETKVVPLADEEDTPSWYDEYGWIQFTETDNWQTVKEKSQPFYQVKQEDRQAVSELVSEIRAQSQDRKAQLQQAIHFVQDKVRYTGIEMGVNSLIPYSPASVLERRFGDCKDKTMLFLSILDSLGIGGHPVFVSSYADDDLNRYLPSEALFDHMIARVDFQGRHYWIDLTRTNQGRDVDKLYQPDFGFALVLDQTDTGLVDMNTAEQHGRTVHITETYDLSAGFDKPARLSIQSRYYGYRAERLRGKIAAANQDWLAKQYLDYMSRIYPDLQSKGEFHYEDDREANVLSTAEEYLIPNLWEKDSDGTEYLSIYQYEINDVLKKPDSKNRKAPYKLAHPVYVQQTTNIIMPETWNVSESTTEIDTGGVQFRSHLYGEGNKIHKDSSYKTTRNYVKAEEIAGFIDDINRISDKIDLYVYRNPDDSIFDTLETLFEEIRIQHVLLFLLLPIVFLLFALLLFFYRGNNPWLKSWFSPKQTIAGLLAQHSRLSYIVLIILIGISSIMGNLLFSELGDKYPVAWLWALIIVLGPLTGFIHIYLWGALLSLTGKWLNGSAPAAAVRLSVAWSNVPMAFTVCVYLLLFLVMKNELFKADTTILDDSAYVLSYFLGAVAVLVMLVIWYLVNHVAMLAEVQKFSLWRSIGNIFLSTTLFVGAIVALVMVVAIPYGIYSGISNSDTVKDGPVKEYYENGKLKGEWNYSHGKLHGVTREYHEDGALRIEVAYKDDKRHGVSKSYFEHGGLDGEWNYVNGKKHGVIKRYYPTGQLKGSWEYQDGNRHGTSRGYYENGQLRGEWRHEFDKRQGLQKEYFQNGHLDGEWSYENDERHGMVKRYYDNGVMKGEWQYKNDVLDGVSIEYYEDGNRKSFWTYKAGKKHGVVKTYYENGQLKMEYHYKNGKYHGVIKEFFDSGSLKMQWTYSDGVLAGSG